MTEIDEKVQKLLDGMVPIQKKIEEELLAIDERCARSIARAAKKRQREIRELYKRHDVDAKVVWDEVIGS